MSKRAKRENWNGKYVLAVRAKGKLLSWKKWNPFTSRDDTKIARSTGSFSRNIIKTPIGMKGAYSIEDKNVEYDYKNERFKFNKTKKSETWGKYQYFVRGFVKNKEITGYSRQYPNSYSTKLAREEALDIYLRLVYYQLYGVSDPNVRGARTRAVSFIKDEGIRYFAWTAKK